MYNVNWCIIIANTKGTQLNQEQQNQDHRQNREPVPDLGKEISDTVRSALQSGDLTRLRELGPKVKQAVQSNINNALDDDKAAKNRPQPQPQGRPAAPPRQPQGRQTTPQPYQQAGRPAYRQDVRPAWQGQTPAKRQPGPPGYTGLPSIVLGFVGMAVFGVLSMFVGGLTLAGILAGGAGAASFVGAGLLLGAAVGATALTISGFSRFSLAGRVRKYYALLEHRSVYTFDEIAHITGREAELVKKDIKKAMRKNMMPDIRLDFKETSVIRGDEAYRQYIDAETGRKALQEREREQQLLLEKDPEAAQIDAFKKEGVAVVQKIRRANDAIPGEEISGKLQQLENTTGKIFTYVEEHPEKLPDTRRFMNYYLPTTLKLVEKYQEYEGMDLQLASVVKAKGEIEGALDKINVAFHNLLDSLYQDDTLDVTTDIEVLETMLEQEGLAKKRFEIDTPEPGSRIG